MPPVLSSFRFLAATWVAIALISSISWCAAAEQQIGDEIEFREEISAILTRAGCNSGACHGSLHGKGGFHLSLKGEDPDLDFRAIVDEFGGRRIDLVSPEGSLVLAKPTGKISHQGGTRFDVDSIEYQNLKRWIEEGALKEKQSLSQTPASQTSGETPEPRTLKSIQLDIRSDWLPQQEQGVVSQSTDLGRGVLERWIGETSLSVPVQATGYWSDGTTSDVTPWTRLECTSVTGASLTKDSYVKAEHPIDTTITGYLLGQHASLRLNFVAPRSSETNNLSSRPLRWVDVPIQGRLDKLGLPVEQDASPELWLRRLYLTTLGRLPSPEEQSIYWNDPSFDRDELAVDRVLADSQFAALLALRWSDVLRNEPKGMSEQGVALWNDWLRAGFSEDRPIPDMVRDMLVTMGSTFESPAASFHRTHRDPESAAEAVGQVFLGIRMQCAKCHNHPFDVWTQDDYYGLSAFFVPLERKQIDNQPRDTLDSHVITGDEIISWSDKKAEIQHPGRSRKVPARTLVSLSPKSVLDSKSSDEHPLEHLANSITRGNEQFERNIVNRLWAHIFGRGIVDPIDDFRSSNPPSNPELLELLRKEYVANGYSTRWLVREILLSNAFRRGSIESNGLPEDEARAAQFAGFTPKRMIAEVLQDAIVDGTQTLNEFESQTQTKGQKAGDMFAARAVFYASVPLKHPLMRAFGKPERLSDCDCERSGDVSLRQSLILLNDSQITQRLQHPNGLVQQLARQIDGDSSLKQGIDTMYRSMVCRSPTPSEVEYFLDLYSKNQNPSQLLEDIAWSLLNSKEFLFVR